MTVAPPSWRIPDAFSVCLPHIVCPQLRVDGVTRCTHAIGGAGPSGAFLRHPKTVLLPQDTRTLGATIQPSAQCALQAVAATGRFGGGGRWDDGFLNQDVLVNVNVASICNNQNSGILNNDIE